MSDSIIPIDPQKVDIRLVYRDDYGEPEDDTPIQLTCPKHKKRIGKKDSTTSLRIYQDNIHCYGCHFHIARRYEALGWLLGFWDGDTDDNKVRTRAAMQAKSVAHLYIRADFKRSGELKKVKPIAPGLDIAYQNFLWNHHPEKVEQEYRQRRGFTDEIIKRAGFGYDAAQRYTIPVYGLDGKLITVRFRHDDQTDTPNQKYEGIKGHNDTMLYPLNELAMWKGGILRVVEGEYDAWSYIADGMMAITITNGAPNLYKIPSILKKIFPHLRIDMLSIASDQDEPGELAAKQLMESAEKEGFLYRRERWTDYKDYTDLRVANRQGTIWYEEKQATLSSLALAGD